MYDIIKRSVQSPTNKLVDATGFVHTKPTKRNVFWYALVALAAVSLLMMFFVWNRCDNGHERAAGKRKVDACESHEVQKQILAMRRQHEISHSLLGKQAVLLEAARSRLERYARLERDRFCTPAFVDADDFNLLEFNEAIFDSKRVDDLYLLAVTQRRDARARTVAHHPVLCTVRPYSGTISDARLFVANYLGSMTRVDFFPSQLRALASNASDEEAIGRVVHIDYPPLDSDYYRQVALLLALAAVPSAQDRSSMVNFTVVDIGAGWGRLLVNAHRAVERRFDSNEIRTRLIGVEAEPTHFSYMKQHFEDNGINPSDHLLINAAAVAVEKPEVKFMVGRANEWYGQALDDASKPYPTTEVVRAIRIGALLRNESIAVDLLIVDTGRQQYELINDSIVLLTAQCRYVLVTSSSRTEHHALRATFKEHTWIDVFSFEPRDDDEATLTSHETPFGSFEMGDGLLLMLNPRLMDFQRHYYH